MWKKRKAKRGSMSPGKDRCESASVCENSFLIPTCECALLSRLFLNLKEWEAAGQQAHLIFLLERAAGRQGQTGER